MTALTHFRIMAESKMTETVRVGTLTKGDLDNATGTYPEVLTIHYSGPGRIKYPSMVVSEKTPVGQVLASQDVTLGLPVGEAGAVEINDTVWIDASSVDQGLVGETFTIKGEPQKGQVSSHRFPVATE